MPSQESLIGFSSQAAIGKDELYILYVGKEFYKDDEEANLVFHLDSDLKLKQIIFLEQSISSFDIDWKNKVLYGFSNYVEGGLVRYQLQ